MTVSRAGVRAFAVAHRVFLPMAAAAVLLRLVAMLGYRPVLWFPDSYEYVAAAVRPRPGLVRPSGYSLLLVALKPFHELTLVAALQHLMGIGIAVIIYAVLRTRWGLPGWGASLATVPVLFDAYQIQLEHLVMSDTLFVLLVVAAVALLMCGTGVRSVAAAGLLLGLAAITRSVGLPLLAVAVGYLVVSRAGWRSVATLTALCVLPICAYSGWYALKYDKVGLTGSSGVFLYGRTMTFADCRVMKPPAEELPLCVSVPPDRRGVAGSYLWGPHAPLHRVPGDGFDPEENRLAGSFAKRAILAQPGDYLLAIGKDVLRTFQWGHPVYPDRFTYRHYLFTKSPPAPPAEVRGRLGRYQHGPVVTHVVSPYAGFMTGYQRHVRLPGTLLGVIMLAGLAGGLVRRREVGVAWLPPWGFAVTLLVVPAATAQFDYRYVLAVVPFACLAAGAAFGRRPERAPATGEEPGPKPEARLSSVNN